MYADENKRNEHQSILDGLSPQCGAVLAPIIASIMAEGMNQNQIAALGNFVNIVGDSLGYIAAQMELNEGSNSESDESEMSVI